MAGVRSAAFHRLTGGQLGPLLSLMAAGALTSCASFGSHQAFTFRKTFAHPDPTAVLTYSYDRSHTKPSQPFFKEAYEHPLTGESQRAVRNRILYELMGVVDDHYFSFTRVMRSGSIGKGILTDTLGVATSLASTAAGGNEIKTILSAISTGTQGVSKSIDSNVLMGSTLEAIRLQMDSARADIATVIIGKIKNQNTFDYPLEAGLRDIITYYDAGTLTNGLAALSKEAGKKKSKSQEQEAEAAAATQGLQTIPTF